MHLKLSADRMESGSRGRDRGGTKVRAAVVSGLGNTRRLIERIKKGEAEYDFVEVMACRADVPAAVASRSMTI